MIKHKNRVHKGFSLMPETIAKIKIKAIEEELNDSRALDLIVHEWFGSKEIEPIKRPPNLSDLTKIQVYPSLPRTTLKLRWFKCITNQGIFKEQKQLLNRLIYSV